MWAAILADLWLKWSNKTVQLAHPWKMALMNMQTLRIVDVNLITVQSLLLISHPVAQGYNSDTGNRLFISDWREGKGDASLLLQHLKTASVGSGPTHRKEKVGFIVPADNKQQKSDLISAYVDALF